MPSIRLIRSADLTTETTQTPGMTRAEAFSDGGMWSGLVTTAPGMVSGWHHHGDYDTVIYVVAGRLRFESGAGGEEIVDAAPGDFLMVPRRTVHGESNPTDRESAAVVLRIGSGPPVTNVDGPAGVQ
jgi:uncharacterized RmlC-like cupin family protein